MVQTPWTYITISTAGCAVTFSDAARRLRQKVFAAGAVGDLDRLGRVAAASTAVEIVHCRYVVGALVHTVRGGQVLVGQIRARAEFLEPNRIYESAPEESKRGVGWRLGRFQYRSIDGVTFSLFLYKSTREYRMMPLHCKAYRSD